MKKVYSFLLLVFACFNGEAQTVLTTGLPSSASSLSGSPAPFGVSFIIENTNAYAIVMSSMEVYRGSASSGMTFTLLYNATSLSGTSNLNTTPGWTSITSTTASTVTTTAIHPTFTGMNFLIPANTVYRFAVTSSGTQIWYGGATTTPNSYSAGGVVIGTGNYQINGQNVGYAGAGGNLTTNPRFWAGTITFAAATPCVFPPTAGTAIVSNANPCAGSIVQLNATGGTGGLGQTYQWETSSSASGPYTPVGTAQGSALMNLTATSTGYYRVMVTCNGMVDSSTPVLVTIPALFPAGTYTINSALPTGGTNFASFSDAASAINCGVTGPIIFNVAPGTYSNDYFRLDGYINAPGVSVTINGNDAILSNLSSTAAEPGIIRLNGTKNVTVDNLNIQGISNLTTQWAWGVLMTNNADSNTISNCTITLDSNATSQNYSGIVLTGSISSATTTGSGCDGITITNNVITGGYYGITLMGNSSAGILQGNTITNNVLRDFYVYGIYANYSNNMLIEGNDISRPTRTSLTTFYGVYAVTGHTGLNISKNRIHDPAPGNPVYSYTGYGIYSSGTASAAAPNTISNNLIYNFQGSGTGAHYGIANASAAYHRYYYNTISLDYTPSTTTGITYGFYQSGTAAGIEFKNNNISITKGGTAAKYGLYFNTPANVIVSNNNNIYVNGAGGLNNVGYYNALPQPTLLDWQTASSQDAASVSVDPAFASPAVGDYMPTNGSLDNLGTPVSVLTDILNMTRSATTPDIGAYEFAVPPCIGNPTAGLAAGPTGACSGINFSINLSGYTIGTGISIQWQSSPAGTSNFTNIPGATGTTLITSQTAATDYQAVVTCANGGGFGISNLVSVALNSFYLCYCSPLTNNVLHTTIGNYITNVTIQNTSLNNTTTAFGGGGYTQTDPSIASNTAILSQSTPYTLDVTKTSTTYGVEAWVDWDQSGTFDAGEYFLLTTNGLLASTPFTVPATALIGQTGMRVRVRSSTSSYTATGACTSMTTGYETEDYVITIAPPPSCQQPTGLAASNMTGSTADVSWSSVGTAIGYEWAVDQSNTLAPGATTPIIGSQVTTPPTVVNLSPSTTYYLHVRTDCGSSSYSFWSVYAFSTPPPNDPCSNAVDITNGQVYNGTTVGATQSEPACDATNPANDVWYSFTTGSIGGSVTVTGITTGVMDIVLQGYSGACGTLTPMVPTASSNPTPVTCIDQAAAGTDFGTFTVSPYTTYYVRVYGYLSAQGAFTIQATGAPLSIKLTDITAMNMGARNRVNWTTSAEVAGDYFIVERSGDGSNYSALTKLDAKGQPSAYTYWDERPLSGVNNYRLKMVDASGNYSYSRVVSAVVKDGSFVVEAYPNPVNDVVTVKVFGTAGSNPAVCITDATGKILTTVAVDNNKAVVNMSAMAAGIYFIKYTDDAHSQTLKINKR